MNGPLTETGDREETRALHQDLGYMIEENARLHYTQSDKLNRLSQVIKELRLETRSSNNWHQRDKTRIEDVDAARKPHDFNAGLDNLSRAYRDFSKQSAILTSLNFPSRPARLQDIPEAHEETFQWAYDTALAGWLKTGSGIFWISGKAGSGKSCFMKYLVAQSLPKSNITQVEEDLFSTREPGTDTKAAAFDLLTDWARPKEVAVVSHYFWSAGTRMQRSQHGLLQSLLYDTFKACPACIPFACKSRWRDADSTQHSVQQQPWSIADLVAALEVLSKHMALPMKFCWFVDGLDEFEGDYSRLCEIILKFSKSANFKICLASRPLNIFADAFGKCPRLCIHDCTKDDIALFARQQLCLHERWTSNTSRTEREQIINAITARANGVFLWVYLVTRSLRDGLTNDDDANELQQRLDSLPTELENLFLRMLESVDKVYHDKMAGNFLLALGAWEPLSLELYAFHDREYGQDSYALDWPVDAIPDEKMELIRSRIGRRLNARSQGLLESKGGSVQLLHRTVRDFLRLTDMSEFLASKAPPLFDPALSTVKAYVALIKSTNFCFGTASPTSTVPRPVRRNSPGDNSGWLIHLLNECFRYASAVSDDSKASLADVLDNLERSVVEKFRSGQARFYCGRCDPRLLFREQLLRSDLSEYLASKFVNCPDFLTCMEAPPLFIASRPPFGSRTMIAFLLSQPGAGPNEISRDIPESTPWLALSVGASALHSRNSYLAATAWNGLFSLYLAHGADPNAHPPLDRMTAFGMFLLGICFSGFEEEISITYLQVLSDFIQAGASLDIEPGSRYLMPLDASQEGSETLAGVFLQRLKDHEILDASTRRSWERFVAQVISKLIRTRVLHRDSTPEVLDVIRSTFSNSLAQELVDLFSSLNQNSKRRLSGGLPSATDPKKQRHSQ